MDKKSDDEKLVNEKLMNEKLAKGDDEKLVMTDEDKEVDRVDYLKSKDPIAVVVKKKKGKGGNPNWYKGMEATNKGKKAKKKLTAMQERFCQILVHEDVTKTEAARRAGYAGGRNAAGKLTDARHYPVVVKRSRELQEINALRYGISYDKSMRDLKKIRNDAWNDGQYSAAIQAERLRLQASGLLVDRKEIRTGKIESMKKVEIINRLNELRLEAGGDAIAVDAEFEETTIEDEKVRGPIISHDLDEIGEGEATPLEVQAPNVLN